MLAATLLHYCIWYLGDMFLTGVHCWRCTVVVQESYFNILVPTMDTTRYSYMLRTILASGRNVLFGADTGVGKSVIVSDTLNKMTSGAEPKFVSATVNFSAQTQSWNLQEVLETKLDKKRKNRWVPKKTPLACVRVVYVRVTCPR